MAWGMRLYNDAGRVVFSSDNPVLQLLTYMTVGPTTVGLQTFYQGVVSGVPHGYVPVVFIGCRSMPAGQLNYLSVDALTDHGGGTWTITASAFNTYWEPGVGWWIGGEIPNVDFYIFTPAPPRTPAAGEFGMRMWDSSGRLTLDTARRILKPAAWGKTALKNGSLYAFEWNPVGHTTVNWGSIPPNWAASCQITGRAIYEFNYSTYLKTLGITVTDGYTFAFQAIRPVTDLGQSIPQEQRNKWYVDGNHHIMFINTDAYRATTGVF